MHVQASAVSVSGLKSGMQFEDCTFTSTVRSVVQGLSKVLWHHSGGVGRGTGKSVLFIANQALPVQATDNVTMVSITPSGSAAPNLDFKRCDINMPQAQCIMVPTWYCTILLAFRLAGRKRDSNHLRRYCGHNDDEELQHHKRKTDSSYTMISVQNTLPRSTTAQHSNCCTWESMVICMCRHQLFLSAV